MSTDDKNLPYSERIKLRREQAKEKQLTVAQLIELLKQQPPDAKVWHEGCDCWGMADGIDYYAHDNEILITRSN
jgi:hypothetical protein